MLKVMLPDSFRGQVAYKPTAQLVSTFREAKTCKLPMPILILNNNEKGGYQWLKKHRSFGGKLKV